MTIRRVSFVALFFALAGLVAVPTGAQAQERAPTGGEANYSSLIEALNNTEAQVRALEQQEVQNVQLANVEQIRQGLDDSQKQELETALEEANTEELRSAISENQKISTALEEAQEDVSPQDVVAVNVLEDGQAVVYYDPSA